MGRRTHPETSRHWAQRPPAKDPCVTPLGPVSSARSSRYQCLGGAVRPEELAAFALIYFTLSLSNFTQPLSIFD